LGSVQCRVLHIPLHVKVAVLYYLLRARLLLYIQSVFVMRCVVCYSWSYRLYWSYGRQLLFTCTM